MGIRLSGRTTPVGLWSEPDLPEGILAGLGHPQVEGAGVEVAAEAGQHFFRLGFSGKGDEHVVLASRVASHHG